MTQRFRLFPIVIVTAVVVLGLKVVEVARNENVSFASIGVALAQEEPAEKKAGEEPEKAEMKKDAEKAGKGEKMDEKVPKEQEVTSLSQSQIALLEALSKRRVELDNRDQEIDLRAKLLKAAEKRIDGKIKKLEEIRDEIAQRKVEEKKQLDGKFKKLVSIYEGMKPKEAARILSRLDADVVLQVAERIAPRKMSAIMAKMDANAAERLTIQLANKAAGGTDATPDLPRIGSGDNG